MKTALTIIFIIIAIALAILVLSQEGKDNGFTGSFTGSVDTYWSKNKKHSKEARMQRATAILGALFIIVAALLSSKFM
ncbi:MAG: preprotein translocase subunit SecG [Eubacterium sp.]|nr:preprotein translocase subunit SecG [Eubacterium sp.]